VVAQIAAEEAQAAQAGQLHSFVRQAHGRAPAEAAAAVVSTRGPRSARPRTLGRRWLRSGDTVAVRWVRTPGTPSGGVGTDGGWLAMSAGRGGVSRQWRRERGPSSVQHFVLWKLLSMDNVDDERAWVPLIDEGAGSFYFWNSQTRQTRWFVCRACRGYAPNVFKR
jgi:hypothetical protein